MEMFSAAAVLEELKYTIIVIRSKEKLYHRSSDKEASVLVYNKNIELSSQWKYVWIIFFVLFFFHLGFKALLRIFHILSRSFITGGQKLENPGKDHLTIRKLSHM